MDALTTVELAGRIIVALACGVAIGLERQWRQRNAGLRTNALVAVGAALFVIAAALTTGETSPTRVAAQVASGVGFLGAGVIMRTGTNVHGLNTASTIWCAAGVGVLAGSGFHVPALLGASTVLGINFLLRPVAYAVNRKSGDRAEQPIFYRLSTQCNADDETQVRSLIVRLVGSTELSLQAIESSSDPKMADSVIIKVLLAGAERRDEVMEDIHIALEKKVRGLSWRIAEAEDISDPLSRAIEESKS